MAGVPYKRPTAVMGRRVGAFVIDFLIWLAAYVGVFAIFAERRSVPPGEAVNASITLGDDTWAITGGTALLFFLLVLVLGFLYWAVLPGLTGWTVGKLVTGIRVVGQDGSLPAGVGRNLVRQLMGIADYFPYFIPGLTGFIVALAASDDRRVGDMVAKTYVMRREAAGQTLDLGRSTGGAASAAAVAAAGWYPDPHGTARLRYWDGRAWTEHTAA